MNPMSISSPSPDCYCCITAAFTCHYFDTLMKNFLERALHFRSNMIHQCFPFSTNTVSVVRPTLSESNVLQFIFLQTKLKQNKKASVKDSFMIVYLIHFPSSHSRWNVSPRCSHNPAVPFILWTS